MNKKLADKINEPNIELYREYNGMLEHYTESTYELDPAKVKAFIDKYFISKEEHEDEIWNINIEHGEQMDLMEKD